MVYTVHGQHQTHARALLTAQNLAPTRHSKHFSYLWAIQRGDCATNGQAFWLYQSTRFRILLGLKDMWRMCQYRQLDNKQWGTCKPRGNLRSSMPVLSLMLNSKTASHLPDLPRRFFPVAHHTSFCWRCSLELPQSSIAELQHGKWVLDQEWWHPRYVYYLVLESYPWQSMRICLVRKLTQDHEILALAWGSCVLGTWIG